MLENACAKEQRGFDRRVCDQVQKGGDGNPGPHRDQHQPVLAGG